MAVEPNDPTNLKCSNCGEEFELNCARVVRAVTNPDSKLQTATARLCWVCSRLFHSVRAEMAGIRQEMEAI